MPESSCVVSSCAEISVVSSAVTDTLARSYSACAYAAVTPASACTVLLLVHANIIAHNSASIRLANLRFIYLQPPFSHRHTYISYTCNHIHTNPIHANPIHANKYIVYIITKPAVQRQRVFNIANIIFYICAD